MLKMQKKKNFLIIKKNIISYFFVWFWGEIWPLQALDRFHDIHQLL